MMKKTLYPIIMSSDGTSAIEAGPSQSEIGPKSKRHRTFLSDTDKLMLVRICVDFQHLYIDRKKGKYWDMVKKEFEGKTG
jgi:hypothetical protein